MNNFQSIWSRVEETWNSLADWNNLSEFVDEFPKTWLNLGNCIQQQLVQAHIEEQEQLYSTPRTKWSKRYYTPLGEITIKRRVDQTSEGLKVKVDEELGLPKDKWLPMV